MARPRSRRSSGRTTTSGSCRTTPPTHRYSGIRRRSWAGSSPCCAGSEARRSPHAGGDHAGALQGDRALGSVWLYRGKGTDWGTRVDLGLNGKVALVAASSKGLGKASALALARECARVTSCARSEADMHATAGEIRGQTGAEVLAVPADLASEDGIHAVVAATAERFG